MKRFIIAIMIMSLTCPAAALLAIGGKRLPNGFMLDPAGTQLVEDLARFFKGDNKLIRQGETCKSVPIRYTELDGNDRFYQWVVKRADKKGNYNGIAEVHELQAMFDTACRNRGQ